MCNVKVVELKDVTVVVEGAYDAYNIERTIKEGRAIVIMDEPECICIGDKVIKDESELPDRLEGCTLSIYYGAEAFVSTEEGLLHFIGDMVWGDVYLIPTRWLEILGYRRCSP